MTKAESACTSANGNSGIGSPADFLLPRIQLARKRLDVEKAVEVLGKATSSCRAVSDLPKLEAMILAARSVRLLCTSVESKGQVALIILISTLIADGMVVCS